MYYLLLAYDYLRVTYFKFGSYERYTMHQAVSPAQMRLIHVTHAPYSTGQRCDGGGCPAVYETSRGTYVIIGRRLMASEKEGLPMDGIEDALEVPRELLRESAGKLG